MSELTMRHVRWAAQECRFQGSGEISVAWMLEGWEIATTFPGPPSVRSLEEILTLGRVVEPRHNLGGLRTVDVRVGWNIKMSHELVPAALNAWLDDLPTLGPTEAFHQYEDIHPFRDGNGRTGSILYNLLLDTLDEPIHPPDLWNDHRRQWEGYPNPDLAEPSRA